MDFNHLTSINNLELAWRRLTTTKDARYKAYFRSMMEAYEIGYKENLRDLQQRLRTKEYSPQVPVRIYYPKASGLQRPISLLCLEDQIVLQAITNLFAKKVRQQRQTLIGKSIFSNWLTKQNDSEFFLNDWKYGYNAFRKSIVQWHKNGHVWLANFDLAAFYDTVPHELLLKTIAPHGGHQELTQFISVCLFTWSADCKALQHNHGIPQGPSASDFLAECVMLPIDIKMHSSSVYMRYVDDIRIMGCDELEVRKALVDLDVLCRERGLIPSSEKTSILKVNSEEEIVKNIPPIILYDQAASPKQLSEQDTIEALNEAVIIRADGEIQIQDKSKLRYLLFRAEKSPALLELVIAMWEHNPHFIDAFVSFLENYDRVEEIVRFCMRDIRTSPYDFIRGEAWKLLARMGSYDEISILINQATLVISTSKSPATRIGAYRLLNRCEDLGFGHFCKWSMYEDSPIIQAISSSHLCFADSCCLDTTVQILRRRTVDPSLALLHGLLTNEVNVDNLITGTIELLPITKFVYEKVGLLHSQGNPLRDIIGNKLSRRYNIIRWKKWGILFGNNFLHAHSILTNAEALFTVHKSSWLTQQDAFNDALFRGFQDFLTLKGAPGAIRTKESNGQLIDYGRLLNDNVFKSAYPILTSHLSAVHTRRSSLPSSHPYEKKTGNKTRPLSSSEQRVMVAHLAAAYSEIIRITASHGI